MNLYMMKVRLPAPNEARNLWVTYRLRVRWHVAA